MTELIRTYSANTEEVKRLKLACYELEQISPYSTRYTVEDVYFDLGQDWMWTTIIAHHLSGGTWQALCPRDFERILLSDDIRKTCEEITSDKWWYDPQP